MLLTFQGQDVKGQGQRGIGDYIDLKNKESGRADNSFLNTNQSSLKPDRNLSFADGGQGHNNVSPLSDNMKQKIGDMFPFS